MAGVDKGRADAHVGASVRERCPPDQLHVHVERARGGDVRLADALDPLDRDVVEPDARAERDGGQDRHLRRRIDAADVVGRIRFRVAKPLCLGKRFG